MQDIKRRRALAVSAALALALALGACTDADDPDGTTGDDLGGVTTTLGDTATTMAPTTAP